MYMQEALELVCRKRKLSTPNEYALLLGDMSILIPLDRTVASLQGKRELRLVKKSMLPQIGEVLKVTGKTTDPNGSFLRCFICVMKHNLFLDIQPPFSNVCRTHQRSNMPLWRIILLDTRCVLLA